MKNKGIIIGIVAAVLVVAGVIGAVALSGSSGTKSSTSHDSGMSSENMSGAGNKSEAATSEGSGASNASSEATTSVEIKDYAYSPASITIKVGDTVTWTNRDSVKHDVASQSKSADLPNGPLLAKGESYKFTFTKAGTYDIHCTPHPYMKQTIIVTE